MDDLKTEKWTLEDGRRAERRVTEVVNPSGETERVTELHVEDARPLKLQQRVVEKRKPIVYEREIQSLDGAGNVVEKKVEAVEPKTSMHLIEHHLAEVSSLSKEEDCDCHVTKEEMIETIISAVRALKENDNVPQTNFKSAKFASNDDVESQGIAEEISKRMNEVKTMTTSDKVTWGIIVALAGVLAYVVFAM